MEPYIPQTENEVIGRICADILSLTDRASIETVSKVLSTRLRAIASNEAAQNLRELRPGDPVTIKGITPKYLDGAGGWFRGIESRKGKVFMRIDLDPQACTYKQLSSNYGSSPLVPASCVVPR